MNWLEIVFRIVVPFLVGALAVLVGILRIPWTLRNDDED